MNTRIAKWDYLKFLLIFFVVLGHVVSFVGFETQALKGLYLSIYSFHMPFFILISGIFAKRNIDEQRWPKIFGYAALALLVLVVNGTADFLLKGEFEFSAIHLTGVPWFAWALFVFSIVTVAIRRFPVKYALTLIIVLACFAGLDQNISDNFALARIINFYPFFYVGYLIDPQGISAALNKTWIRVGSAFALIIGFSAAFVLVEKLMFLRPLLKGRSQYTSLGAFEELGPFLRLGYYVAVFAICIFFIAITPNHVTGRWGKLWDWFAWMGQRSVQTYVFHWAALMILFRGFKLESKFEMILPIAPYALVGVLALLLTAVLSTTPFKWVVDKVMTVNLEPSARSGTWFKPANQKTP